jgi:IS1 family transposase
MLKSIYYAYFHSLMKYGIIFWGNSTDSKKVFTLQKKIVRIMLGVKPQNSCRGLFKRLQILPLPCRYIFSLLNFIINNQEHFQTNSAVHSVNTRNKHHLHRSAANLTCFHKSTYNSDIKIFNNLRSSFKSLMNEKAKFKVALKRYLNTHTFYSVDEFLLSKTVSSY